jgi:hypothetical protein
LDIRKRRSTFILLSINFIFFFFCYLDEGWGKYSSERTILANAIADLNLRIVVLAGDAHMLAVDDGRNNKFSTSNPNFNFPVLQSASLDKSPSAKGGPYFFGCSPGAGYFFFFLSFIFYPFYLFYLF